ncbi:hypothetical protein [Tsukamurella sp. TY48]|uniref:hypothetical protein n=1 Tax=Tsukamurella TaxID=2060 RepID=UPI001C7D89FA|nr:hypothetical protein [Tsukamurella sp. TY48]
MSFFTVERSGIRPQFIVTDELHAVSHPKEPPRPRNRRSPAEVQSTNRAIVGDQHRRKTTTLDECESLCLAQVVGQALSRGTQHVPVSLHRDVFSTVGWNERNSEDLVRLGHLRQIVSRRVPVTLL